MELQNISNYDAVCNGNDYMKHVTTVFDMTISGVQKDTAMEFNRILGLDLLQKNADDMQSFSETVVYWGNSWWGLRSRKVNASAVILGIGGLVVWLEVW